MDLLFRDISPAETELLHQQQYGGSCCSYTISRLQLHLY